MNKRKRHILRNDTKPHNAMENLPSERAKRLGCLRRICIPRPRPGKRPIARKSPEGDAEIRGKLKFSKGAFHGENSVHENSRLPK